LLEIVEAARKRGVDVGRNHLVALLKKLCRWATTVDILEASPAATLERPAKPVPRDRVLSLDELGAYWRGLGTVKGIDPRTRWALQLQCILALRIGEVTNARKVEVQLQGATYRIPAERMKAKEKHTVPLPAAAAEIFGRAMAASPPRSPWVFASNSGDGPIRADSAIRALNKLQAEFGFTEPFRSHDVRRTAATMLAAKGVQPLVLDRVLAHKPSSVTDKHYNWHDYAEEKREALELWATIVLSPAKADTATA
jgi:integrase